MPGIATMPQSDPQDFLAGVIEGFYGPPWAQSERFQLFDWMAQWGLNTYFYCPKDDSNQRAIWRTPYDARQAAILSDVIQACARRHLHFIYAISPGLDIRYSDPQEIERLQQRFQQLLDLGCQHFALLFDDIPDRMDPEAMVQFGSLASAQATVTNTLYRWVQRRIPQARFLFCPTPYCARMAERQLGGAGYLEQIGALLDPTIDILWTGPEIISKEITVAHVQELSRVLQRKPMIWDNLHANDYDGRRFYCGPYSGRPLALRHEVRGILTNPNCEFELNYIPFRTLARFLQAQEPWDPRAEYLRALHEWSPQFETCTQPIPAGDLQGILDGFYLPHEDGPEVVAFLRDTEWLLQRHPADWGDKAAPVRAQAMRWRDTCGRLVDLRNRALFYAMHRRLWELREELDLLEKYIGFKSGANPDAPFGSDFHLPQTYRGSVVARLQRLLALQSDGTLIPTVATSMR